MANVEWRVDIDASRRDCVDQGIFPAAWLRDDESLLSGGSNGLSVCTLHPEIVPEIRREALKLLQLEGEEIHEARFQIQASAFGLRDVNGSEDLHCVLKLNRRVGANEDNQSQLFGSWLDAKLHRAEHHRQRGNERFKSDAIRRAVRAYEKALQWLECPVSKCQFSASEQDQIAAIAIPCHANLATCHWKSGDMDACIDHATSALTLDPLHVKARYRRSQAYLQSNQFDEAVGDLETIVAADPESKLFSTGLAKAKQARQQHRARQKQALASAFSG